MSEKVDSNAAKLLGQIEVRYADYSDVAVEEAQLKKELQTLLSGEKWYVSEVCLRDIFSSQVTASSRVQGFEDKKESSNTPALVGAA